LADGLPPLTSKGMEKFPDTLKVSSPSSPSTEADAMLAKARNLVSTPPMLWSMLPLPGLPPAPMLNVSLRLVPTKWMRSVPGGVEEVEYGGGVHRFPGHVDGGQAERHSAVLVHGALDVVLPDVLAERDPEVVVPGGAVHAEGVRGEGVRLLEVQHDVDVFDAR